MRWYCDFWCNTPSTRSPDYIGFLEIFQSRVSLLVCWSRKFTHQWLADEREKCSCLLKDSRAYRRICDSNFFFVPSTIIKFYQLLLFFLYVYRAIFIYLYFAISRKKSVVDCLSSLSQILHYYLWFSCDRVIFRKLFSINWAGIVL